MFLNGESLLNEPLRRRQEVLRSNFSTTAGFTFASSIHLDKFDEVVLQQALKTSVDGGAEGLMIKSSQHILMGMEALHPDLVLPASRTFGAGGDNDHRAAVACPLADSIEQPLADVQVTLLYLLQIMQRSRILCIGNQNMMILM